MQFTQKKIGFIGAGKMAWAIIDGLLLADYDKEKIFVSARTDETLLSVRENFDVFTTKDISELVRKADCVLIGVKPKDVPEVLSKISPVQSGKLFISIAAGMTTSDIEGYLGPGARVIRSMPNIAATALEAATAVCGGAHATPEDLEYAKMIFSSVGTMTVVKESLMDAVTGLSGCGPAFIFPVIEALADGAVFEGLDRETALKLAAQTVLGAAAMALETGLHPGELKDMVCSPGGATIEGIAVLEEAGVRSAFMRAVIAGSEKSKKLGKKE